MHTGHTLQQHGGQCGVNEIISQKKREKKPQHVGERAVWGPEGDPWTSSGFCMFGSGGVRNSALLYSQ